MAETKHTAYSVLVALLERARIAWGHTLTFGEIMLLTTAAALAVSLLF